MTHQTESVMSSPVTISGVESISDVESTISVGDKAVISDTPGNSGDTLFDMGDGDLRLMVNDVTLETHKYLIKRFSGLKDRIRNNAITLESNEPGVEDFQNTCKVLYASVIEGPIHFDPVTLTSALRIATTYDYPALRDFAIRHLEKAQLSAVERIRLAREFGLSSWEEHAYVELCNRDEALTKEEASVLGLDTFVHVARIRENEQRRRGRDVDAAVESDDEAQVGEEPKIKRNQAKGKKRKAKKALSVAPESDMSEGEQDTAKDSPTESNKTEDVGTIPKPSFIDIPTQGTRWRPKCKTWVLDAPGCTCTEGDTRGPCALPPCVASAIKHLQTQQLVHGANISKLEAIMDAQTTLTSPATPKPHAEPGSEEFIQTGCVEEEVRQWLAGVEGCAVIA